MLRLLLCAAVAVAKPVRQYVEFDIYMGLDSVNHSALCPSLFETVYPIAWCETHPVVVYSLRTRVIAFSVLVPPETLSTNATAVEEKLRTYAQLDTDNHVMLAMAKQSDYIGLVYLTLIYIAIILGTVQARMLTTQNN